MCNFLVVDNLPRKLAGALENWRSDVIEAVPVTNSNAFMPKRILSVLVKPLVTHELQLCHNRLVSLANTAASSTCASEVKAEVIWPCRMSLVALMKFSGISSLGPKPCISRTQANKVEDNPELGCERTVFLGLDSGMVKESVIGA